MNESQHDVAAATVPTDTTRSLSSGLNEYYPRTLKNLQENLQGIARQLQGAGMARVFIQCDGNPYKTGPRQLDPGATLPSDSSN